MANQDTLSDDYGHQTLIVESSTTPGQTVRLQADPTTHALVTSGGGGGGGAVTIADGANVVEGATTDAAVTAGSTGTLSGKLRQISADVSSVKTNTTGVSTAAKQPALGTAGTPSADVITVQGVTSMTALKTDGSGVTQPVSGTVTVQQSTASSLKTTAVVAGDVADAATDSGNPVKIAGVYKASPTTYSDGQRTQLLTDNLGQLKVVPLGTVATNETQVNGTTVDTNSGNKSAGTQRVVLATDQPALTNALKVDGSAVTQPVSGTVTANAGTGTFTTAGGKTNNNAAPGATNIGTLPAVSTASAPSYTEGNMVALSVDNSGALRTSAAAASVSDVTATGDLTATGSVTTATLNGASTASVYIFGTWSATVQFEGTTDGTTYFSVNALPITGGALVTSTTANGQWQVNTGGLANLRARVSAYTSGTVSIRIRSSVASATTSIITSLPAGSNTIGALSANQSVNTAQVAGTTTDTNSGNKSAGTQRVVLATDQPQLTNALKVDGSAVTQPVSGTVTANAGTNLNTSTLALESGGNLASIKTDVDNLALAQGSTTSGQKGSLPLGAVTTSAPSYTTAQSSPLSLTTAGALRTDASATTQPVSGTITANAGTGNFATNLAQVSGNSVSTAATGVQKVGVVGNTGATVDSTVAAGTAPTNAVITGGVYNSSAPAPTTGQAMAIQADQAGNLRSFPGVALAALSAWNSSTSLNATQTIFTNSGAPAVLVQLDQTTTLTAGAVTFEATYDGTNWVTVPANTVMDPTSSTYSQISIPYTVQASTNKPFIITGNGWQGLRVKLSTQITGTGTVTPNYALLPYDPVESVIAYSPTAANFNVTLGTGANTIGALSANQSVNTAQVGGTNIDTNSGNKSAGTQRMVIATDQPNLTTALNVSAAASSATGSAVPANAFYKGLIAKTANPSAASDGNLVGALSDKLGKQVVVGSIRDLKVNTPTSLASTTSETTVLSAVASTFLDVYGVILVNGSATAVSVAFKDSTAGTTQFKVYVPAGETRGIMLPESGAIKQGTVNNNWTATPSASVTPLDVTMLAVKNI